MGVKKMYVGTGLPVVIRPSSFPRQDWETEAQRRGESVLFSPLIYLPNLLFSLDVGASVWACGDWPQSALPNSLTPLPSAQGAIRVPQERGETEAQSGEMD